MTKVVIALALVLAGVFLYWRWSQSRQPPAAPSPPAKPLVAAPPQSDAQLAPRIQHPIEKAAGGARPTPLPSLDDSDGTMRDKLAGLFGAKRLAEHFFLEGIVRRIVATVDSLPREQVAPQLWAVKPTPGELQVDNAGGNLTISAKNAARYTSRVQLAESVDPKKLVALYVRHYPLFQRAYEELGYPQGYFNDRLIEVIDHLLATPDAGFPIKVIRPRVRYEFVDPTLQSRSAGQKLLARVGPENASRLKVVLNELRREITGQRRLP
jgi:hypothetical protein